MGQSSAAVDIQDLEKYNVFSGPISVQPTIVASVVIIGSKYTVATLPPNVSIHRCEDV